MKNLTLVLCSKLRKRFIFVDIHALARSNDTEVYWEYSLLYDFLTFFRDSQKHLKHAHKFLFWITLVSSHYFTCSPIMTVADWGYLCSLRFQLLFWTVNAQLLQLQATLGDATPRQILLDSVLCFIKRAQKLLISCNLLFLRSIDEFRNRYRGPTLSQLLKLFDFVEDLVVLDVWNSNCFKLPLQFRYFQTWSWPLSLPL